MEIKKEVYTGWDSKSKLAKDQIFLRVFYTSEGTFMDLDLPKLKCILGVDTQWCINIDNN